MATSILLVLLLPLNIVDAISCWQCAAVDNRKCPEDATLVTSVTHDACITWRVGNGSILLQNLVRYSEECAQSKVSFWSNFIDLYYRGTGGNVQCCTTNGCNIGSEQTQNLFNRFGGAQINSDDSNVNAEVIQGLPAELPGASLSSFLQQTSAYIPPVAAQPPQPASINTNFQVSIFR